MCLYMFAHKPSINDGYLKGRRDELMEAEHVDKGRMKLTDPCSCTCVSLREDTVHVSLCTSKLTVSIVN